MTTGTLIETTSVEHADAELSDYEPAGLKMAYDTLHARGAAVI